MTCTEKKRLNGKTTSRSNRPAHETSESIYSKFQIEMNAKNEAYAFILSCVLLSEFIEFSRAYSGECKSTESRLEMALKTVELWERIEIQYTTRHMSRCTQKGCRWQKQPRA